MLAAMPASVIDDNSARIAPSWLIFVQSQGQLLHKEAKGRGVRVGGAQGVVQFSLATGGEQYGGAQEGTFNRSPQGLASLTPGESGEFALSYPRFIYVPERVASLQEPEIMNGPALAKGDIEHAVSGWCQLGQFLIG